MGKTVLKTFKRQLTETHKNNNETALNPNQTHHGYEENRTLMEEDETSKLHRTRLSFPSDFTSRAKALRRGVGTRSPLKTSEYSKYKPKLGIMCAVKQGSEARDNSRKRERSARKAAIKGESNS